MGLARAVERKRLAVPVELTVHQAQAFRRRLGDLVELLVGGFVRLELGPRPPSKSTPTSWVLDAPTEVGEEFAQAVEICLAELLKTRSSRRSAKTRLSCRR